MKKPKLGTGARFSNFVDRLEASGKSSQAAHAIAAAAGRKKYGAHKMAVMAAHNRKGK